MWMGGVPPLGYRAQDGKLIIIESEAETVRFMFRRYAELGSVRLLKDELDARRFRSKLRTSASGRLCGGKPFARTISGPRSVLPDPDPNSKTIQSLSRPHHRRYWNIARQRYYRP